MTRVAATAQGVMAALLLNATWGIAGCDGCTRTPRAERPRASEGGNTGTGAAETPEPALEPRPEPAGGADSGTKLSRAGELRELTWRYPDTKVGPIDVVVAIPAEAGPDHRMPVLIALHGMGEARKSPADGARGWIDDYALPRAVRRLCHPPLTAEDFQGFVAGARLRRINRSLAQRPYRGLIVVSPYTPLSIAGDRPGSAMRRFGELLVDELLPRIYRETPARGTAASTGIDGVSFGGRIALMVGFRWAERFGSVASTQAGCLPAEAPGLAALAANARERNPGLKIRLLTSTGDGFRRANREISQALSRAGVDHQLLVIEGPHNYQFNRGPGSLEMLIYHDRVLRGGEGI